MAEAIKLPNYVPGSSAASSIQRSTGTVTATTLPGTPSTSVPSADRGATTLAKSVSAGAGTPAVPSMGTSASASANASAGAGAGASASAAGSAPAAANSTPALSAEGKALLDFYSTEYERLKQSGDMTGAQGAHSAAEEYRASLGYSGGADGSQYIPLAGLNSGDDPAVRRPVSTPAGDAIAGMNQSPYTDNSDMINSYYKIANEATMKQLEAAYNQNVLAADAAAAKIPGYYQDARNQTAGAAALNSQNFNAYAAASGLNTGAGGQAQLAMNNAHLGSMTGINRQEAQALQDLENERLSIERAYNDAIAQAYAEGNLQKMAALIQEQTRIQEGMAAYRQWEKEFGLNQNSQNFYQDTVTKQWEYGVSQDDYDKSWEAAQAQAEYGDFSGLASLYGWSNDITAAITEMWWADKRVSNPQLYNYLKGYSGGTGGGTVYVNNNITAPDEEKLVEPDPTPTREIPLSAVGQTVLDTIRNSGMSNEQAEAYISNVYHQRNGRLAGSDVEYITNVLGLT